MAGSELLGLRLCHLGDYEATVFSPYSHNRQFGESFVHGEEYQALAEGYYTVRAMCQLGEKYGWSCRSAGRYTTSSMKAPRRRRCSTSCCAGRSKTSFKRRNFREKRAVRIKKPLPVHTGGRGPFLWDCSACRRAGKRAAAAVRRPGKAHMSRWNGEKVKAVFGGRGFYIALAFCLVAAGVIGYYTLLRPQQPTTPEPSDTPVLQPEWTVPSQPEPDDADEPAAPTMEPAQPEDLLPAGRLPARRDDRDRVQHDGASL